MNGDSAEAWKAINDARQKLERVEIELQHLKEARKTMQEIYTPREMCTVYRREMSEKLDDIKKAIERNSARGWQIVLPIISSTISALIISYVVTRS